MPWDKLEEILDEVVSQLMENIKKRNLESHESETIIGAIERVASEGALSQLWELDTFEKDSPWYAQMKKEIMEYEVNISE